MRDLLDKLDFIAEAGVPDEAKLAVKKWAKKYYKYSGVNGDELPEGYLQAMLSSGINSDAYDQDEYAAYNDKYGHENDLDWEDGEEERFFKESPITKGMFTEILAIQEKYGIDENDVNDIIGYFDTSPKGSEKPKSSGTRKGGHSEIWQDGELIKKIYHDGRVEKFK